MILMIANNNSPYSGYNEVSRVDESGDESEKKCGNWLSARAVVLILNFIILQYMIKQLQFNSLKQIYVKLGQILLFTNSIFFLSRNNEVSGVEETEDQNENIYKIGKCK